MLRKQGKTAAQLEPPKGWRLIPLLSCTGKVIETVMTEKMIQMAEQANVLPPGQLRTSAGRLTEPTARVVVEWVRAAQFERLS